MARAFLTQVGTVMVDRAFHGLLTVTRVFDVNAGGLDRTRIEQEVLIPYGTADEQFKTALLIKRNLDQSTVEKSGYELRLVEVYQELKPGQKVSVEEDQVTRLDDGRTQMTRRYVCLAADAETLAASVGTVLDGRACANVVISDQGLGAEITETYLSAGILAQSTDYSNNGALEIRSVTYFNGTPTTPAGFTLVATSEQNPAGLPGRTYRFARGLGEVSRSVDLSGNGTTENGAVGVSRINITFLTGPSDVEPTWADVAGYVKCSVASQEQDGHLVWRAVFAKGAGTVSSQVQSAEGGRVVVYQTVSLGAAPASPSATIGGTVTLVDSSTRQETGHVVYDYTWIEGLGEISRSTDYDQSTDQGATGVTAVTITHVTPLSTATDPTSSPGFGFVKVKESKPYAKGYRVWTVVYAKGTGLVAEEYESGPAGLRRVTYTSLGTKVSPTGIIDRESERISNGYVIYTVSALQTASGGADPTTETWTVQDYVDFTYPGRAKAYSEVIDGFRFVDVYLDPPVTTKVLASIAISYTATPVIGFLSPALWNPTQWAVMRASWVGLGPNPASEVRPLPGYRSVSTFPITHTASGTAPSNLSCRGSTVYGGETATIVVEGGPSDPGGNSYTLDAYIDREPAFKSVDGTKYYRKVVITATIPAQPAIPV